VIRAGIVRLWPLLPLLIVAGPTRASVFDLFGAGPRAVALSGTMAAAARGGEASFHNPALLAASPVAGAWGGWSATGFDFDVKLARPVCKASWQTCHGQFREGFSNRAPALPRGSQAFVLGWHYPVGGVFQDRVSLGAGLAFAQAHLLRISGPDPQTPNFLLYEGAPERLAFLLAGSVRVTDWWWLGVGAQVLAVLDGDIAMSIDATNHDTKQASVGIGLRPRARLTAGTALHPMRGLWLGVGYRQRLSLEYRIPAAIDVGKPMDVDLDLGHETLFTPDTLATGFAWRALQGSLLLTGDLTLQMWSAHPDPSPQVAVDASGPALEALGAGDLIDVGKDTPPIKLGFRDTWSPSVAVEWRAQDWLALRTGYRYRPSPAPYAVGPFNYLDNDAHAVGLGAGFGFGTTLASVQGHAARRGVEPGEMPWPLHVDVGGQVLWLPRRTVYKTDPNDPVGDLQHGGLGAHVGIAFGGAF
jgi:hypothetical protein